MGSGQYLRGADRDDAPELAEVAADGVDPGSAGLQRSQIRRGHNAGLPNQAREPARADSVRRVGLPGVATAVASCD